MTSVAGARRGPGMADRSLPRAVERHARERPHAPAVSCAGEALDYATLNARANRIAHRLRALGAGPGVLVGLCLPRGAEFIVALLGILKAGAAYLPLDPDYPPERLRRNLRRAQPLLVVTRGAQKVALGAGLPTLCLDAEAAAIDAGSAGDPDEAIDPEQLCYVIFTSGSTGEPNGVMVTHGNVARLFDDLGAALGLGPTDAWGQLHSCAFGFSVFEIWGALTHGARLDIAPAAARADARILRGYLRDAGITILSQTPTALRETVLTEAFTGAWSELAVRALVLSGEAVSADDLARWAAMHAARAPRLVNTYAITETGGNVMLREYAAGDLDARNIGRPLEGVTVHVLDAGRRAVRVGDPGELWVGGQGIAAGYLNDPDLTAERFATLPGTDRAYRTGDRVRCLADGTIEFLGRMDEQVKWRGHRLELGEIESLLRTHPGVSAAAAAIHHDDSGAAKLVAYVVPGEGARAPARGPAVDGAPELWPSLGGYQVYDGFLYDLMSADPLRNEALRAAFARHARGRVVLDFGTGSHALLARLAAEAGARKVYAIELLPEVAARAGEVVAAAGLADRITVIAGDAASLELPEPADLCTQGIIGNIGSADGIAPLWNRVRPRLAPEYIPVPARCKTLIAPVELPDALHGAPAFAPLALDYVRRIFRAERRIADLRLCLRNLPRSQLLAEPCVFEELDFTGELPESWRGQGRFTLRRAGRFDGFLLWTVVTLADGLVMDHLAHQQAWLPVFMPLPDDGPGLARGAVIDAEWAWRTQSDALCPDYTISAAFTASGAPARVTCTSRHHETARGATAFHRRLLVSCAETPELAPESLRAWLARHLPEPLLPNAWMMLEELPRNPNGKLDRRALPAPAERTWGGRGGAPRTALESDLAALWSEILGVAAVGMQDNFFDLGGDSIAAVRLTTRMQQLLDDGVMLAAVFEAPTLDALARMLCERHAEAVAARYGVRAPRAARRPARPGERRKHGEL